MYESQRNLSFEINPATKMMIFLPGQVRKTNKLGILTDPSNRNQDILERYPLTMIEEIFTKIKVSRCFGMHLSVERYSCKKF